MFESVPLESGRSNGVGRVVVVVVVIAAIIVLLTMTGVLHFPQIVRLIHAL